MARVLIGIRCLRSIDFLLLSSTFRLSNFDFDFVHWYTRSQSVSILTVRVFSCSNLLCICVCVWYSIGVILKCVGFYIIQDTQIGCVVMAAKCSKNINSKFRFKAKLGPIQFNHINVVFYWKAINQQTTTANVITWNNNYTISMGEM